MSDLLKPGDTETETMFDFCSFVLTTGTTVSSVFGACEPCGSESNMRCRWRVRMMVCNERRPSCTNIDLLLSEGSEVAENVVTAAA